MNENLTYSAFESRFKDKQYIGSGGFSKVYKVFDHAKNHYVALKVADVRPEWKQFTLQREVELVNKLDKHQNIARYDACYRFNTGITGEMDFAVLKFYEYGNLEQFLSKEQLSLEDKRRIIQGVLEGVAFLHRNNITHRDLKSQNILLHREDGVWTPKITDFGLARQISGNVTMTNSAIGLTFAYAAPEQIQNERIYKNVDLWAAGVIIYRIIAGELPFKGYKGSDERSTQSQLELSRKILNLDLPDAINHIQEPYQTLIRRCLVLDAKERAQTAEELIAILNGQEEMMTEEPVNFAGDMGNIFEEQPTNKPAPPVEDKHPSFPPAEDKHPSFPPANDLPPEIDDYTEILLAKKEPTPSIPPLPPPIHTPPSSAEEYHVPKDDFTQVVKPIKSKDPAPEPPPAHQPKSGEPSQNYFWLWAIIFMMLIVGAFGVYYFWEVTFPPPIPPISENTPAGVVIVPESYIPTYQSIYDAAKSAIADNDPSKAIELFKEAIRKANANNESESLSAQMKKDGAGDLKEFSAQYQTDWGSMIKSLEKN